MSVPVAPRDAAGSRREQVLRAMGLTMYRLRGTGPEPAPTGSAATAGATAPVHASCVLVLPSGCTPRGMDLVGRAMVAFGATFARAPRLLASDGELSAPVPEAAAYLVFGEAQARALGRALPATAMAAAQVALLDEPALLSAAEGKRRLWDALKALRRSLRAGAAADTGEP